MRGSRGRPAGGKGIPGTGVSNGISGGADLIFQGLAAASIYSAASGLFITLVIQIPAVSAMIQATAQS